MVAVVGGGQQVPPVTANAACDLPGESSGKAEEVCTQTRDTSTLSWGRCKTLGWCFETQRQQMVLLLKKAKAECFDG